MYLYDVFFFYFRIVHFNYSGPPDLYILLDTVKHDLRTEVNEYLADNQCAKTAIAVKTVLAKPEGDSQDFYCR